LHSILGQLNANPSTTRRDLSAGPASQQNRSHNYYPRSLNHNNSMSFLTNDPPTTTRENSIVMQPNQ